MSTYETWNDVDLLPIWEGDYVEEIPTLFGLFDGISAAYVGKLNSFIGEPEACKTWGAFFTCLEQLRAGKHVMWIDLEDSPLTAVNRLKTLGATRDELERFHYKRPDIAPPTLPTPEEVEHLLAGTTPYQDKLHGIKRAPTQEQLKAVAAQLEPFEQLAAQAATCTLVIIDSVTELLSLYGLNGDSREDIGTLHRRLRTLFTSQGPGVIMLDHVTKSTMGRGRWASGSERKIGGLDGSAITFETLEPFGRGKTGKVKLSVSKDRPGFLRGALDDGKTIGELILTSDGTLVTWEVKKAHWLDEVARQMKQPVLQAIVDVLFKETNQGVNQLIQGLAPTFTGPKVREGIKILETSGTIAYEDGPNRSKLYYLTDPENPSVRYVHTTAHHSSGGVSVRTPMVRTPHTHAQVTRTYTETFTYDPPEPTEAELEELWAGYGE